MIDIIIPAYNEEHRIEPTLRSYADYFNNTVQLTVVLNGCTDNTLKVVESVQKKHYEQIKIINVLEPIGKGGAIVRGWKESSAEWLGFLDADGSTSAAEFQKVIEAALKEASSGASGAIASRFHPEGKVIDRQSVLRKISSRGFVWWVRLLFGMPYIDTQCGAKLFTREALKGVLDKVHATDMTFDVELLWRLYQNGVIANEVPSIWIDKPGSAALGTWRDFLGTGFRMIYRLWNLRLTK